MAQWPKKGGERLENPFTARPWQLAHGISLELGPKAIVMGILNVTPDSFSDGGRFAATDRALAQAGRMMEEGAAIIDIGGESTRPGAEPVSPKEEQARVLPVIEALAGCHSVLSGRVFLSIDTYRAETARLAIAAGAHIVNDVWGFQREPEIGNVVAQSGAGCVLMHNGRERRRLDDVIDDQRQFLQESLNQAHTAGVGASHIVLDPGFGFAKEVEDNVELLARFEELLELGYPLLTGTSRKRFVAHYTGGDNKARDAGTVATSVIARMKGSAMFRVHEVAANVHALAVSDAILAGAKPENVS